MPSPVTIAELLTSNEPQTSNLKLQTSNLKLFSYHCISNYFMLNLHTYNSADQRHIKYYFLMATLAMDSIAA